MNFLLRNFTRRAIFAAASLALASCLLITAQGATTYLLIEAPSATGGATQTYRWRVDYTGSTLLNGQDLFNVIFGAPPSSPTGGSSYTVGDTSGAGFGVRYTYFDGFGMSPQQFYGPGFVSKPSDNGYWVYLNAGGTYYDLYDDESGSYLDGVWQYGESGLLGRSLADPQGESYDAFVFAGAPSYAYTDPTSPVPSTFAGPLTLVSAPGNPSYQVYLIGAVPEPGRIILLACGLVAVAGQRRRSFSRNIG